MRQGAASIDGEVVRFVRYLQSTAAVGGGDRYSYVEGRMAYRIIC